MATVEITCPHCNRPQKVAEYRLKETVYCLVCQQLITDVYLYKVAPKQQELNIKLKGRLVSEFGTTKLEELKSKADDYTGRFDPVSDEDDEKPDETTRLFESGSYRSLPEKPRMSTAAKTYLAAGIIVAVLTVTVLIVGFTLLDDSGPSTGEIEAATGDGVRTGRYPSGNKRAEWHVRMIDGLETYDGAWQEWHIGGENKLIGNYVAGKRIGTWTGWHENGTKSLEHHYENGVETGLWVEWHANGRKSLEGQYINGIKDGEWRTWHAQGGFASYEKYEAGTPLGDWVTWYPDGRIARAGTYENGLREGRWIKNYDTGQQEQSEEWVKGILHGDTRGYHLNRREAWRGSWVSGKRTGMWVWWYSSGQLARRGAYLADLEHGTWQEWHEAGPLKLEGSYEAGQRHGPWLENHEDGSLAARREYDHGTLTSERLYFGGVEVQRKQEVDPGSGRVTREYTLRIDETGAETRHGLHHTYQSNGLPKETGAYVDGKKHGPWRTYDEEGDVIDEVIYENGRVVE